MVEITHVRAHSLANRLGLKAGDKIININNKPVRDYIDYLYQTAEPVIKLTVQKQNGKQREFKIEKDYDQVMGIEFSNIVFDGLKQCHNDCIFCFVKQLPPGLRNSLNIKDDDYRFSFLQGSYITLTNLKESDFKRIINLKLSPLYISVHTTNPGLRKRMMKNPEAGKIMEHLKYLVESGIHFHAQIVLCPGINDKQELDRTIEDLTTFYPSILSLGIVPVGLTKYRDGEYSLKSYGRKGAKRVLQQITSWQKELSVRFNNNWIYAADEFYFLAGKKIPGYEHYNGFPQFENGIGLVRQLWEDFESTKPELPAKVAKKNLGVITGKLGEKAIFPVINYLNENIKGLNLDIIPVRNDFLGEMVTVTGLLSGQDIIETINRTDKYNSFILPAVALNDDGLFIDDISIKDLKRNIKGKEVFLCSDLQEMLEVMKSE